MPDGQAGWLPVDHACRFCGGRIMSSGKAHRCFHCDTGTDGPVSRICGCGCHPLGAFRCAPNTQKSVQNPAAVIIERAPPRVRRPAKALA